MEQRYHLIAILITKNSSPKINSNERNKAQIKYSSKPFTVID